MNAILLLFTAMLCVAILVTAVTAIIVNSTPIAILATGLISLLASVVFVLLAAPDVAMTEAAIGSGLTTFLFFFVLARVRGGSEDGGEL